MQQFLNDFDSFQALLGKVDDEDSCNWSSWGMNDLDALKKVESMSKKIIQIEEFPINDRVKVQNAENFESRCVEKNLENPDTLTDRFEEIDFFPFEFVSGTEMFGLA